MAFSGSALAGFDQGWRNEDKHQAYLDQHNQQMAARALDMDFAAQANPMRLEAIGLQNTAAGINNQYAIDANPKRLQALDFQNQAAGIRNQSAALDFGNKQWAQPYTRAGIQMQHGNNAMNYELNQHALPYKKQALDFGHQQAVRDNNLAVHSDPYRYNAADRQDAVGKGRYEDYQHGRPYARQAIEMKHNQAVRADNYDQYVDPYRYNGADRVENKAQADHQDYQTERPYRQNSARRADNTGKRAEAVANMSHPYQMTEAEAAFQDQAEQRLLTDAFRTGMTTGNVQAIDDALDQVFGERVDIKMRPDGSVLMSQGGVMREAASLDALYNDVMMYRSKAKAPAKPVTVGANQRLVDPATGKVLLDAQAQPNKKREAIVTQYSQDGTNPGAGSVAGILFDAGLSEQALANGVGVVMQMDGAMPEMNAYQYIEGVKRDKNVSNTTVSILSMTPQSIQGATGVDLSDIPITEYEAKTWAADIVDRPEEERRARLTELVRRKAEVERQRALSAQQRQADRQALEPNAPNSIRQGF